MVMVREDFIVEFVGINVAVFGYNPVILGKLFVNEDILNLSVQQTNVIVYDAFRQNASVPFANIHQNRHQFTDAV